MVKALVLSGGSEKGAYTCGVLKHLLGDLKLQFDIFCGVSAGAINAAFLAQFGTGHEEESIFELIKLWSNLKNSNIYKRHFPFGKWHILYKPHFFDSKPLHNLIKSAISLDKIRSSGKQITVGAVSLNSGKYAIFDQNNDNFINAVIASASFPTMLTPVMIDDEVWVDGGIKTQSPLKTAIDLGADEIVVITTAPEQKDKRFIENPNIIDIVKRIMDLATGKIMENDIEKANMYNILAQAGIPGRKYIKLDIIQPDNNLTNDLLDFSPSKIKEMMEIGYEEAKRKYRE